MVRSLCTKIHISAEETDDAVQKVREHKLGYLFENMEKIDIQQLRKEAEEWRKLGEEERQKAKEEQQKAKEEQQKRIEEQQKRIEEQQKIKRMSMTILKAFFDDPAEYDMELIKCVIDSTDDTNRIVSWTDATENCSDKTALYNEIIGK